MSSPDSPSTPWSLKIRGETSRIFELSDALGFESPMSALSVSVFEDGTPERQYVEALYDTQIEAQTALSVLNLGQDVEAAISQTEDADWVSLTQSGLPPVKAGRFWVYGEHDAGDIPKDVPYPILINAGMAFGTGHHGTTKGCLMIFDDLLKSGFDPATILDLGTGAGTLAIGAAMALKRSVLATDIDQDAVDVTLENASVNGVADHVSCIRADGFGHPDLLGNHYELIFANILAGPLMGLAPEIARALTSGGTVILSGILDEQAPDVAAAFNAAGVKTAAQPSIEGWTSLLGKRA